MFSCARAVLPRKKKVLDETFALEESKRLELEYLAREKKEAERRLQLEHEATKVRTSRPTRGGKRNVLRACSPRGVVLQRGLADLQCVL